MGTINKIDFPGGPVIKNVMYFSAGGPGSITVQGTRSHIPQLKILNPAAKTQHSQINKYSKINKIKVKIFL